MRVQLTILGSGSNGNCAYLEAGETRLLIDAGLSGRQIRQRLLSIGRVPECLSGILLTHEHTDHTQGLNPLATRVPLPVYCNRLTKDAVERQLEASLDYRIFETGSGFDVGGVSVETFSVPHDAHDPVGFVIRAAGHTIAFLTDLGHSTKLVIERIRPATVLVIEANHDLKLLQEDLRRPWSVKQRILSRHGHLSNDATADVVRQVISGDLRRVYLGHLSRDCNRPELAHRAVSRALEANGVSHIKVENTFQDIPCATLGLDRDEPTIPQIAMAAPTGP